MRNCRLLSFLAGILICFSCSEFIEESLEDKKVLVLAPVDKYETSNYNMNLWWDRMEGAEGYRIQIASPNFDSVAVLIADTLTTVNKIALTLPPGRYQWRIRAENNSSKSFFTTRSFTIRLSTIAEQQVTLSSPAPNFNTNQKDITFKWSNLFGALKYRLQVDTNRFLTDGKLVLDTLTTSLQFSLPLTNEKTYEWRVRGESDSITSRWSEIRQITYDGTPPGKVTLTAPQSNAKVPKPVLLQWSLTPQITTYEIAVLKSDSLTTFSSSYPKKVTQNSLTFNEGASGDKLFWKVRAMDQFGNTGPYSESRSFTIE